MNMMMRALSAEALKLRGTLALWASLIAPALVVALIVLQLTIRDVTRPEPMAPAEAWVAFASMALQLWAFLMMPLFITLQSALLAGLEHANHQWKHLLSLPVPKGIHYLAKLAALLALTALALLVLGLLLPLGGWMLMRLHPELGLGGPPPWKMLATAIPACLAASALIIAIHTWVSIRWRNFTVAVSVGIAATVAGFLIMQSRKYGMYYPWSMPLQVFANDGAHLRFAVTASLLGGSLVSLAGLWNFVRHEDA
ncbi:ABC transporter permease [Aerolutibacter ruishenii]|uniref:ABC-2 type transport system permease protein n=1 Tax=Aerolutibacter ruishenii TaxID=686800 RepID=A0A562LSK7_9GAMM|nr:ABC transporter permease [Lysobacter ruishenii]TWI10621.1 hypothetical protein IP93_01711 [Lysobacter ruishenii]